ncbi:MAG TPA: ABC transporter ATP-binding protein [Candidatus Sulfotelmatobacter sp.]|jgi:ABC-type multidrug transport system fused ATPase/permease subunit|nr:ABC transporter ATP-binding protein [Candidatus Sulfotelmatobacter sp.]
MKSFKQFLLSTVKPSIGNLLYVVMLMLFVAGLEALLPWPFKFLIDNVLGDQQLDPHTFPDMLIPHFSNQETLGVFIVFLFFLISIFLSFSEYYQLISVKKAIRGIVLKFSQLAFRNLENLDMGFYREQEVGDYIYRLSYDVNALGDIIELGILPMITSFLFLLITTVILLTISIKLTLISLAVLPFLAGSLYIFNKRIVRITKRSEYWNSAVFSFIQQALTQLKVIQSFSQEQREANKFDHKMQIAQNTDLKLFHVNFLLSLLVGIIVAISYSFIIGIGIQYFYAGEITTGLLIVFIFYLDNLTNPILTIIYAWSDFKESRVKIYRMREFFNKHLQTSDTGKLKEVSETSIEFRNVSFQGEEGEKILDRISFQVKQNTLTVLVGVSGSGKTSLISLISRLISEPTSGEILIGGKNIKEYSIEVLRKSIAYVPQENVLFNDTIRNVISFGKFNATEEDIHKAAKLAVADEFIKEHPHGYNFHVGEEGNYLSGGQRQRLSIARAFIKDAKILIFDEPLSSLDIQTRAQVWKNIHTVSKNKTTIIVTNILDVITQADQVIVMSKGKIVEMGKYEELAKKSNFFHFVVKID